MSKKYISIITTSYNCDRYIENTIKTVIGQDCPVQYIVMDADSQDGTKAILNKYSDSIDIMISEPDHGMYHGIQKGATYVRGEIMGWLNADDSYLPWTFSVVEEIFKKFPDVHWIIGQPSYMNRKGQCIKVSSNAGTAYPNKFIKNGWFRPQFAGYLQQESMFWRKSLWDKVGGLNLDLKLAADFDLWTRFAEYEELYCVSVPLSSFRLRPGEQQSSVSGDLYAQEVKQLCQKLLAPRKLWQLVSGISEKMRVLSRIMLWKKCKIIAFSSNKDGWIIKEAYRPLSRYSLAEALLDLKTGSG